MCLSDATLHCSSRWRLRAPFGLAGAVQSFVGCISSICYRFLFVFVCVIVCVCVFVCVFVCVRVCACVVGVVVAVAVAVAVESESRALESEGKPK